METQNKITEREYTNKLDNKVLFAVIDRQALFKDLKTCTKPLRVDVLVFRGYEIIESESFKFKTLQDANDFINMRVFEMELKPVQTAQDLLNETETESFTLEERTDLNIKKVVGK